MIDRIVNMNIKKSLEKIVFFEVRQDLSNLTDGEKKALSHCVKAGDILADLYLSQIYQENLALREALKLRTDTEGMDLFRYFEINGGPWDEFNEHQPFISGIGAKPKGGTFYPADITSGEWETWLVDHPAARSDFESNYTVVRREFGALKTIPYHVAYKDFLEPAARELKTASALLPEGNLRTFLDLRADSFLSDDYWKSDIAWIDTNGNPFEVTIGPNEVYDDRLFGLKATYETFIALSDEESTRELQKFSAVVPEFDASLAARLGYKPKGGSMPLEVVRDVYRGGDAAVGRQFVAFNLPNDRKIHEVKGSKKVFSRTMMEAKFSRVGEGIAKRILKIEDIGRYQFRGRLLFVLGHELAHGVGPGTREVNGEETSFEVFLKDLHSMIEEAKADVLGAALLDHFYKKGLITIDDLASSVVTEIVAYVQGWRASYTEAHSAGSLVEYNWLKHNHAVRYDENTQTFDIDPSKAIESMISLSNEFLGLQTESDYKKASLFIKKWGFVSPEIPGIVARLEDLPVEVHPLFMNGNKILD